MIKIEEQIEIEFKLSITEDIYNSIKSQYSNEDHNILNITNYYFDTSSYFYYKNKKVIRIREIDSTYELTIKNKLDFSSLEENYQIYDNDFHDLMLGNSNIKDYFNNLEHEVYFVVSVETTRMEFSYKNGIIALDRCEYLDHIDYEIEYEVKDYEQGKIDFLEFIKQFNLEYKENNLPKQARVIERLLNN